MKKYFFITIVIVMSITITIINTLLGTEYGFLEGTLYSEELRHVTVLLPIIVLGVVGIFLILTYMRGFAMRVSNLFDKPISIYLIMATILYAVVFILSLFPYKIEGVRTDIHLFFTVLTVLHSLIYIVEKKTDQS